MCTWDLSEHRRWDLSEHRRWDLSEHRRWDLSEHRRSVTPSLPQPVNVQAKRCRDTLANSVFSGPVSQLLSIPCILIKSLSHARAKIKTKWLKDFKFCTFIGHFQMPSVKGLISTWDLFVHMRSLMCRMSCLLCL